jgi:DNA polymerase-3 subunit delta'
MVNSFQTLIGQPQAVALLTAAIAQNRIAPAYLLTGPEGVGKSLAARALGEALLMGHLSPQQQGQMRQRFFVGNHPDLLWIEPRYQHQGKLLSSEEAEKMGIKRRSPPLIRIEQIRQIHEFLSHPPLQAPRAVIVIQDSHSLNEGAANALLKTLEEPGRATLILLAPSVDSLLPTLVSRCQRIPFYRLSNQDLTQVLQSLGRPEILQDPEVVVMAQGSPGTAILTWERLQTLPENLRLALVQKIATPLEALTLAKNIEGNLDTEQQLWLVDYLQTVYWRQHQQTPLLKVLEKTRRALLAYVQPRLVWEDTLLQIHRVYENPLSG